MPPVKVITNYTERRTRRSVRKAVIGSPNKSSIHTPTVIYINTGSRISNITAPDLRSSLPTFEGLEVENLYLYLD